MKTQKCMCVEERKHRLAKKKHMLKKIVSGHSYMKVYVLATQMEPNWSVGAVQQPDPNGTVKYPRHPFKATDDGCVHTIWTMRAPASSALAEKYWHQALLTSVFCQSRGFNFRNKTKPLGPPTIQSPSARRRP